MANSALPILIIAGAAAAAFASGSKKKNSSKSNSGEATTGAQGSESEHVTLSESEEIDIEDVPEEFFDQENETNTETLEYEDQEVPGSFEEEKLPEEDLPNETEPNGDDNGNQPRKETVASGKRNDRLGFHYWIIVKDGENYIPKIKQNASRFSPIASELPPEKSEHEARVALRDHFNQSILDAGYTEDKFQTSPVEYTLSASAIKAVAEKFKEQKGNGDTNTSSGPTTGIAGS